MQTWGNLVYNGHLRHYGIYNINPKAKGTYKEHENVNKHSSVQGIKRKEGIFCSCKMFLIHRAILINKNKYLVVFKMFFFVYYYINF